MKRFRTYRTSQEVRDKYADVSVDVKDFIGNIINNSEKELKDEIKDFIGNIIYNSEPF